ncbi:hypothetical protein CCMA1212_004862 [Trichoderma ghanense]|uniref:Uncharacterized protein n=1 Tax=Trichoderma ghanense TaxID=65468 RepID=A0ABY2H4N3_9HYPO
MRKQANEQLGLLEELELVHGMHQMMLKLLQDLGFSPPDGHHDPETEGPVADVSYDERRANIYRGFLDVVADKERLEKRIESVKKEEAKRPGQAGLPAAPSPLFNLLNLCITLKRSFVSCIFTSQKHRPFCSHSASNFVPSKASNDLVYRQIKMPHALIEFLGELLVQLPRAWRENGNWAVFKLQFLAVYVLVAGFHAGTCLIGHVVNWNTSDASCLIAGVVVEQLLTLIMAFPFI